MQPSTHVAHGNHPRIITDLLRPEAHDHVAEDIRLHETHSSWVVLAGEYAYKLKKPVHLGFLNFTTLESRRADCEEEVRLNRRFSPDVYLGVAEITEQQGHFRIGGAAGSGEPAVWMRRLPEAGMLPELLARGEIDTRLARRIGRKLAAFHSEAATGEGVDEYGSPSTVTANWQENFKQMAPFVGRTVSNDINEHIRAYVERFLDAQRPLLERRVAQGRVRDGHGDLHAASICIEDGGIRLFDSLQFAPRFRCADVAAEVAFLAMDLEHHGRADLAWAFVDAYVGASGDADLMTLLDFYACYRAYVRGKVRSLRLAQLRHDAASELRITSESKAYFDLAWAHTGGLGEPKIRISMGLPASGKTTLARALASRLGLVHLSSDLVRKSMAGVLPTQRGTDAFRKGLYDPAMTERTYAALRRHAARWLRRGRSVLLDATYADPVERAHVRRLAQRLGVQMQIVLCRADDATLRGRLARRATESGVVSDARLELWPELRAAFREPDEIEGVLTVDATAAPEQTADEAIALLLKTVRVGRTDNPRNRPRN
jgi:aminoglycoside phosphotransferase family enzyme/predicted kinase